MYTDHSLNIEKAISAATFYLRHGAAATIRYFKMLLNSFIYVENSNSNIDKKMFWEILVGILIH